MKFIYIILFASTFTFSDQIKNIGCKICNIPIHKDEKILVDAWNNKFHASHLENAFFCNSCSRIISKNITHGGYKFKDNRFICSLCMTSNIKNIEKAQPLIDSVYNTITQLGFIINKQSFNVTLNNLNELKQKLNYDNHALKGITQTNQNKKIHHIYILDYLTSCEFQAVLGHELIHVWIKENNILLSTPEEEGLCNLIAWYLYQRDNTYLSNIHMKAMMDNENEIYGIGFKKMKNRLKLKGWNNLINELLKSSIKY